MGYYEFPHSRNYDTDLGYLIKQYKELIEKYNMTIEDIKNLDLHIMDILTTWITEDKLHVNAKYDKSNERISFNFEKEI